jgi:predicted dehydrogenase
VSRTVRVGVLGAGSWAAACHIPTLAKRSDAELVVVCRRDGDLVERMRDRFGFRAATTDYREALAMGLDAVIVAGPAATHEAQVIAALEAGAHVLSEKPFALDPDEAWRMVEASSRTGRSLQVAFGWNFMPIVRAARAMLVGYDIGQIEHVVLNLGDDNRILLTEGMATGTWFAGEFPPHAATYTDPSVSGGGTAAVAMSHAFGMIEYLTRMRVVEVFARMFDGRPGVDLHDSLNLLFENGAIGAVSGAAAHPAATQQEWHVMIYGSGGQLLMDVEHSIVRFIGADGRVHVADLPADAGRYEPNGPTNALIDVAQGSAPGEENPAAMGARTVDLVTAAYASVRSGRSEPVGRDRPGKEGA